MTLESLNDRFVEAIREMHHVMFRTSYPTIVRDSTDVIDRTNCLDDIFATIRTKNVNA